MMRGRWSDIVGSPAEEKGRDQDLVQLSQYDGEITTSMMTTKRMRMFMMRKIVFGSPTMNLMMKNRKIGGKGEEDQKRKAGDRGVGAPRKPWVGVQGRRGQEMNIGADEPILRHSRLKKVRSGAFATYRPRVADELPMARVARVTTMTMTKNPAGTEQAQAGQDFRNLLLWYGRATDVEEEPLLSENPRGVPDGRLPLHH